MASDVEFNLVAAMRQRMAEALALAGTLPMVGSEEAAVPHGFYPIPTPWTLPIPQPWMPAVGALVAAVTAQQLAATVEGPLRAQLEQSASASIAQVLDDYCGTPPRLIPWRYPGPPPWVFAIASELNAIANASKSAAMQAGLLKVAGQVLERGFGQTPSAR
jgi:hypothetical protein